MCAEGLTYVIYSSFAIHIFGFQHTPTNYGMYIASRAPGFL
jgi:hypothetical protein